MTDTAERGRGLSRALTFSLATAAGLAVANLYYNQPMLGLIAREFGAGGRIGLVPAATQLGYAAGLVLLVPLGDTRERRGLILKQCAGLALALVAAALAPNGPTLVVASVGMGLAATIAQQIVPLAAELARPGERGRVVGQVMSGLLTGILLARTLSGYVGRFLGWRAMFWIGAGIALAMAAMLRATLPRTRPSATHDYKSLLASMVRLTRELPALRRAVLVQGALFAAFSAFWTTLALYLQGPPFHLGSDVAGLFGLAGLAGVTVAPLAGRESDRRGPLTVIGVSIPLVLAGYALFEAWRSLAGLVVGVALLDAGIQASLISHQAIVLSLSEEARSRVNTVFVTGMFLAGAVGSATAAAAFGALGWTGVVGLGGAFALVALAGHVIRAREPRPG